MKTFKGDLGKVRKVVDQFGGNADCFMFNDKRKNFRRIKIWTGKEYMYSPIFKAAIKEAFGDRFIDAKPINAYRNRCSYAIYLNN